MKLSLNRAMAVMGLGLGLFAAVRAQVTATKSMRVDQFQNDEVKVWKTTVATGEPLPLHRHDHGRVVVALSDGKLDLVDSSGTHDLHVWQKDHAYWLPAMPPGAMHQDVNAGDGPIELMVVEVEKAF